jgi:hypothetical protein
MGVLAQAKNGDAQFWNRNFMQPMGRLNMPSKCLDFFSFKFWRGVGGGNFSVFLCSLQVPNGFPSGSQYIPKFPLCSSRVFPIAPGFNPMCFGGSRLLHTYVDGPKGEALFLSKESSTLGSPHSFNFFVWWANQIGSLQNGLVNKYLRISTHLGFIIIASTFNCHHTMNSCMREILHNLL